MVKKIYFFKNPYKNIKNTKYYGFVLLLEEASKKKYILKTKSIFDCPKKYKKKYIFNKKKKVFKKKIIYYTICLITFVSVATFLQK